MIRLISAADYSISTSGGVLTLTSTLTSPDTLNLSEPAAGQILFAAPGRTFSVNGGPVVAGQSGNVALSGISSIAVTAGDGNASIVVGGFNSPLPSLAVQGGAGIDSISFGGTIAFADGQNLSASAESISVSQSISVTGAGAVNLLSSGDLTLLSGSHISGTAITLTADSDANGSGIFTTTAGSTIVSGGGTATITAADVALGGTIDAGAGTVAFHASQSTAPISLGANAPGPTQQFAWLAGSTSSFDEVSAVKTDAAGNIYVAGLIDGTAAKTARDFLGNTVTGYGSDDIYVAKFNAAGVQQYFKMAGTSGGISSVVSIGVDSMGALILTGLMDSSNSVKDFNGNIVAGPGGEDIYVTKLDAVGNQQYFKFAGSTGDDSVVSMVVDSNDNVILAGVIDSTHTPKDFAGNLLTMFGGNDIFVAKLDSAGLQQYIKVAGSTLNDTVSALTVDASGNAYVSGLINGNSSSTAKDFSGTVLTAIGGSDIYVAKLNVNGLQQYFKVAGGFYADVAPSKLIVDGSGNIFLAGTLDDSTGSKPKGFDGTFVTGYSGQDIFVAKLNSAGAQQYFKIATGNTFTPIVKTLIDGNGNFYLTGNIDCTDAGIPRDFNGSVVTGNGFANVYVAKIDSAGNQQFFNICGSNNGNDVSGLAVDGAGNVYVSGSIYSDPVVEPRDFNFKLVTGNGGVDIFLAKLNSSGAQQYFKLAGSQFTDRVTGTLLDASGDVYIAGTIDYNYTPKDFNGNLLPIYGGIFIAKLDASGTQQFFSIAGSTNFNSVLDILLDTGGNLVVVGNMSGGVTSRDFNAATLVGNGYKNTYVTRLSAATLSSGFVLTNSELNLITAGAVAVSSPSEGAVVIREVIEPKYFKTLACGNNTAILAGAGFVSDVGPTFDVAGHLTIMGSLTLDRSATISFAAVGGFVATPGQVITAIVNDGTDAITGLFLGLPANGAFFGNVLGSNLSAAFSYSGGTGNDITLTVANPITFLKATLPDWTVGVTGYNQTITVAGGIGGRRLNLTSGALPTGLTLSRTGSITGTPTVSGMATFTVTATDGSGSSTSRQYTLLINPLPAISPITLPNPIYQTNYNQTVTTNGGTGTITFSHSGTIPPGLIFNDSTGSITGLSSMSGSYSFSITATDSVGALVTRSYTLVPDKADAGLSLGNLNQTYDGSAKSVTTTTVQSGLAVSVTYNGSSTLPINAGDYTVVATVIDANYQGSITAILTIGKAAAVLIWPIPADITYGSALTETQLNATANVNGTLTYSPAIGATLNAGNNQALSVSFTPADPANYVTTSSSVAINVLKKTLVAQATASSRIYGTMNPGFTGSLAGVVNPDDITATFISSAALTTPVATYDPLTPQAITPVVLDPDNRLVNYSLTVNKATLSITPAPSVVTAASALTNYSPDSQTVSLRAKVSSPNGSINEGVVRFQLMSGNTTIGTPVTSGTVVNGGTSVKYTVPAGTMKGTYAIVATYFQALNFSDSIDNSHQLTVRSPLAVVSGPTATPNPAGIKQLVAFNASATGSNPTYTWYFGDGTTGSGASVHHAYSTAGTMSASITVADDSGQFVSVPFQVQIQPPVVGTGADSDGDGFSDSFEAGANTDPALASSTPFGGAPAGAINNLVLSKPAIKLNFAKQQSDSISFSGTLEVPAGFVVLGKNVFVDVGGVVKIFTLNSSGHAKTGTDQSKITFKAVRGVVKAQTAKYSVSLSKGTFTPQFVDENLTGEFDVKSGPRTVIFTMLFNDTVFKSTQNMSYNAKHGKSGLAK